MTENEYYDNKEYIIQAIMILQDRIKPIQVSIDYHMKWLCELEKAWEKQNKTESAHE